MCPIASQIGDDFAAAIKTGYSLEAGKRGM